jgi:hypothetical protein
MCKLLNNWMASVLKHVCASCILTLLATGAVAYVKALTEEASYSEAGLAEAGGVGVVVTDADITRAVQEVRVQWAVPCALTATLWLCDKVVDKFATR